jgi:hypothetical protein
VAALLPAFLISGCHSYHIDATIENRTGAPIQLLEADYPSASFGIDKLAPDAKFQYRFQVRGSGPLKVSYTAPNGQSVQISGPTLLKASKGPSRSISSPAAKPNFTRN